MFAKFWATVSKAAGPNTIHILDALAALAVTGGVAIVASPGFSDFTHKHSWATALIALGPVVGVPLAAKLRKAAGSTYTTLSSVVSELTPIARAEASAIHLHFDGVKTPDAVKAAVAAAVTPAAPESPTS